MSAGSSGNPAGARLLATPVSQPDCPSYLADLVARAAAMLKARGLGRCVEFSWFADGKSTPYFARME